MKKTSFLIYIIIFLCGFSVSASAYSINVAAGIKDYPVSLVSYEGFTDNTKNAINNSCKEWINVLGFSVVAPTSRTHNTNVYKTSSDDQNLVTRGSRDLAVDDYLMETRYYKVWSWGAWYIYEADIDINVSYPFSNNGGASVYDIQNCMTHEVGHMLGIGHSTASEATMYDAAALGETKKRTLHADDRLAYAEIYD